MAKKTCSKCQVEKSKSEFYSNSYSSDGLRSECKVCTDKVTAANRKKMYAQVIREQVKRKDEEFVIHRRRYIAKAYAKTDPAEIEKRKEQDRVNKEREEFVKKEGLESDAKYWDRISREERKRLEKGEGLPPT